MKMQEYYRDLVSPWLREQSLDPKIQKFLKYFWDNWINSPIWSPKEWSVAGLTVRTNNDIEGKGFTCSCFQFLYNYVISINIVY